MPLNINTGGGAPAAPATPPTQSQTFSIDGALSAGMTGRRWWFPFDVTIVGFQARVETAPDGRAIIVDVHSGSGGPPGATLFSTQANRPTIPMGANSGALAVPNTTNIPAGTWIRAEIDQVGMQPGGSSTTPTFKSDTVENTATAVTSLDVARPAAIAVGDIDILTLVLGNNVTATPPAGRGWTPIGANGTSTLGIARFWRIDDGTTAPHTFTFSASATSVFARHVVYSGVDPASPVGTGAIDSFVNGTGPNTPTQLTTSVANAVITYQVDLATSRAISTPVGYTPRLNADGTTGTASKQHLLDKVQAVAGLSDQSPFSIGGTATLSRTSRLPLRPFVSSAPSVWTPGEDFQLVMLYRIAA